MKAFLFAAGIGSRLRPVTDTVPKCMLEFGGRPLLGIWLTALHKAGVDEVLVNLHHLPDVVERYVASRSEPPLVHSVFEPELLGSAGTLAANRRWIEGEEFFLACNADNLTDWDLTSLIEAHWKGRQPATLSVFHSTQPSSCGIVEVDHSGLMVSFVEKPAQPVSDLANAGMYAFSANVLDLIDGPPSDIGYDLLPQLVGSAATVVVDGYFRDIGTLSAYEQAGSDWISRIV